MTMQSMESWLTEVLPWMSKLHLHSVSSITNYSATVQWVSDTSFRCFATVPWRRVPIRIRHIQHMHWYGITYVVSRVDVLLYVKLFYKPLPSHARCLLLLSSPLLLRSSGFDFLSARFSHNFLRNKNAKKKKIYWSFFRPKFLIFSGECSSQTRINLGLLYQFSFFDLKNFKNWNGTRSKTPGGYLYHLPS